MNSISDNGNEERGLFWPLPFMAYYVPRSHYFFNVFSYVLGFGLGAIILERLLYKKQIQIHLFGNWK